MHMHHDKMYIAHEAKNLNNHPEYWQ